MPNFRHSSIRNLLCLLCVFRLPLGVFLLANATEGADFLVARENQEMSDPSDNRGPTAVGHALDSCTGGAYWTVIAAPQDNDERRGLLLNVTLGDRSYMLGEPIPVRCALVNRTSDTITVPYECWGRKVSNKFHFDIKSRDGTAAELLAHDMPALLGTEIVKIPANHQLIQIIDLRYNYAITKPGSYDVTVEFKSNGTYRVWNRLTKSYTLNMGWSGIMDRSVGTLNVEAPRGQDAEALALLLKHGFARDFPEKQYALLYFGMLVEEGYADGIIKRYPESLYADIARIHSAVYNLERYGHTHKRDYAAKAVAHLEAIDGRRHSDLLREWIAYALIEAHRRAAGLDILVEDFRTRYPNSPYIR